MSMNLPLPNYERGLKTFLESDHALVYDSSKDFNKSKNKLTWELLSQGYTKDKHPEYVRWTNFQEFEYLRKYAGELTFQAPCGLHVKGSSAHDVSVYGIDWCHENGNPIVHCPYEDFVCKKRAEVWQHYGGKERSTCWQCWCNTIPLDCEYDFEKSLERQKDIQDKKVEDAFRLYFEKHPSRCRRHAFWSPFEQKVRYRYNLYECFSCGQSGCCSMFREEPTEKKGNVFYDLKIVRANDDINIVNPNETIVTITRGKRFFDSQKNMNLCRRVARFFSAEILRKERMRNHTNLFFHPEMEIYVENVRAEQRESRDLMADLEAVKSGAVIIHESDVLATAKERKRERAQCAKNKRYRAFLKSIERNGIESVQMYKLEKMILKYGSSDIDEAQERYEKQKANEYEQVSLI